MRKHNSTNRQETSVLFSIHQGPAESILSGRKRIEYRVVPPKLDPPYVAIFYVSSERHEIQFAAIVQRIFRMRAHDLLQVTEPFNAPGTHDRERLLGYLERARQPAGLLLDSVIRLPDMSIEAIREIDPAFRAPENFVYVSADSRLGKHLSPELALLQNKLPMAEYQPSLL